MAAVSALDDQAFVRECVKNNADNRQEFFKQAKARKLSMIDSNANFVMMNAQRPAPELIAHFQKNGVLIGRPFPPLDNYIRVTLGKPAEMAEFWRVWDLAAGTQDGDVGGAPEERAREYSADLTGSKIIVRGANAAFQAQR